MKNRVINIVLKYIFYTNLNDTTKRRDRTPRFSFFFFIYKRAYTILDQYLSTTFPKNDL